MAEDRLTGAATATTVSFGEDGGSGGNEATVPPHWGHVLLRLAATIVAFGIVYFVWRLAIDHIAYDKDALRAAVKDPVEGLTIFAVFFVAAAGIERLLEPLAALVTAFGGSREAKVEAAEDAVKKQVAAFWALVSSLMKVLFWAFATSIGIVASASLELYLLRQVGIASPPRELDVLATGLIIGAGTKPLHDLTKLIEKKKETAAAAAPSLS
ncbi:MAG TPA: hypothetical protein VGO60_11200 [Iamia sp.]|jgi:hypothetical protein|nr:hypothetical protein [Iamia sp.]